MSRPQGSSPSLEIKGNTLRVYLFVLKHGPCELKDVQGGLQFSTASLASYHLKRLIDAGYASQDGYGRYIATGDATSQLLEGYTKVGAVVVPQLLFLSVLFTLLAGYFSYMTVTSSSYLPFLIGSALALVAVLWYETARLWRRLASWK
jgi:hypothetical protein